MRNLNKQETDVLEITARLTNIFLELPEFHTADVPEFIRAIHSIQNIIMSRPAMEASILLSEEAAANEI